jgi:hypothetical protein
LLTDKRSRKIVGYHCGDTLEAEGCLKALDQALAGLPPGAQPIHHSDRGTQYCCHEYAEGDNFSPGLDREVRGPIKCEGRGAKFSKNFGTSRGKSAEVAS